MTIVTLTGPTCAGKSSVEARLQYMGFGRVVSHTTRAPRAGEINGEAYHFVSDEEYCALKNAGKFIETTEFGSSKYAITDDALNLACAGGNDVVIVVEPNGAEQVHDFCDKVSLPSIAVWVDCSVVTQARRWIGRLMTDIVSGKSVADPYAERLALMLVEEAQWRRLQNFGYIKEHSERTYHLSLDSETGQPQELARAVVDYLHH